MKKLNLYLFVFLVLLTTIISAKEFHVSKSGSDLYDGSILRPFLTITEASKHAFPGDLITVHEGTYREWINPLRGGESDSKRIVYRAAKGEIVKIKGSERINAWEKVENGVWRVIIPNTFFGDYNPYSELINGDWFWDKGRIHHTGEVFLNERSMFEKETLEKVITPIIDTTIKFNEFSNYTWYCETDNDSTIIWANFHNYNPNEELTEISLRSTCIYPEKEGIDYITISGFDISQAATQWAPPTAEQIGMIATHWNKGWIIENNIISNSKCSGITLGKERSSGHNVWTADPSIDGSIHYIEVTFRALKNGWNKENVGSHIIRNNKIFDCEQTGICGSMGAAFSIIENNHIYNIWTKRQFTGAEIGGIKFHAPIDAIIRNNRINDCGRGLWLDWMTQGTRVSANLLYNNDLEDLFFEVNHGPFIVDNNILLSNSAIKTQSQGGAYIHNLIAGSVFMWSEPNRFTPYHFPHSTDIAGISTIYSGDDRYINNILIGSKMEPDNNSKYKYGLEEYDKAKLPVWLINNLYYNGANFSTNDSSFFDYRSHDAKLEMKEIGNNVFLYYELHSSFKEINVKLVSSLNLGKAKIPNALFENPDGTSMFINYDYFGNLRSADKNLLGPFNEIKSDSQAIKVW
jgi:hypothetical protein